MDDRTGQRPETLAVHDRMGQGGEGSGRAAPFGFPKASRHGRSSSLSMGKPIPSAHGRRCVESWQLLRWAFYAWAVLQPVLCLAVKVAQVLRQLPQRLHEPSQVANLIGIDAEVLIVGGGSDSPANCRDAAVQDAAVSAPSCST